MPIEINSAFYSIIRLPLFRILSIGRICYREYIFWPSLRLDVYKIQYSFD